MPELPEVERGRKIAEKAAQNTIITNVWVDDDNIVFEQTPKKAIRKALLGRRVLAVKRHGKQLWFELDHRPWPLFHFGMTGAFLSKAEDAFQLETGPDADRTTWPPRFAKIRMEFDNLYPSPLCFFFFSIPRLKCIDPSPSKSPAIYAMSVSAIIKRPLSVHVLTGRQRLEYSG